MSLEGLSKGIAILIFLFFVMVIFLETPFYKSYENKAPEINSTQLELDIHELINEERKKRNLSVLKWDSNLSAIARYHSMDMASRGYFDHESPEGHDPSYRYEIAGYNCFIVVEEGHILGGAENLFLNNLYDKISYSNGIRHVHWNSQEKLSQTTVIGWMNSTGHRKNILKPFWRSEGIGVYIADNDSVYITQNFC